MRGLSIALLLIVCAALWAGQARAQVDATPRARAAQAFDRAKQAERELRFADALRGYEEVSAADPSAPFAPAARTRTRWLQQRSEGEFAPLAQVEAMRRDPAKLSDPEAVKKLEAAATTFPPGLMRAEAWLVVADASVRLLHDPARARAAWNRVLEDPTSGSPERVVALGGLVDQSLAAGDLGAAREMVGKWGEVAPGLRLKVVRLQRRGMLRTASIAILAGVALATIAACAGVARKGGRRALRKVFSGYAVAIGGYLGAGGAALCYAYDREVAAMAPFAVLGVGVMFMVWAGRAWAQATATNLAGTVGAVALGVAGVLAVAMLAMLTSPPLMQGFGL
ncbi:MAG: hypothetical protein HY898_26615 [Deltaproteobacteria bacterium]|nr:hypothetical protein [Deltaproteobacteria bacterium]